MTKREINTKYTTVFRIIHTLNNHRSKAIGIALNRILKGTEEAKGQANKNEEEKQSKHNLPPFKLEVYIPHIYIQGRSS
jgi:hypothetical protein